ncbi:MAG: Rrf2 family transcriptional regulator [Alcaligenaceae bacterium]|nr:MAG: Rrf2 family transcriptional regulator [Alcaligenaceae bacterium]
MKLTDYTDYSLRVLIHVAVHPDEPVTIQQISDAFGISRNHLVKIVQHLGQVGLLQTTRGRTGGIRLGRPASAINLGEVVRTTEPDFGMVECFRDDNQCVITRVCGLKGILHQALKAYLDVLDGYTLQDLVERPAAIHRVLSVGIPIVGAAVDR